MKELYNNINKTLSKYDIELEDDEIIKLTKDLKTIFLKDLLLNLPTEKEVLDEYQQNDKYNISQYYLGMTRGILSVISKIRSTYIK